MAIKLFEDLRAGRNVGVYVNLAIVIGLTVVSALTAVNTDWFVKFAVTALVGVSLLLVQLANRFAELKTSIDEKDSYFKDVSEEFTESLLRATDAEFIAVAPYELFVKFKEQLRRIMVRGGVIRVLLVGPNMPAMRIADRGRDVNERDCRRLLELLRTDYANLLTSRNLVVRAVNFVPSGIVANFTHPLGAHWIYATTYSYEQYGDRPTRIVRPDMTKAQAFYRAEFDALWSAGTEELDSPMDVVDRDSRRPEIGSS